MPRLNVYIPDDLKSRMDEAGAINWSELAQRAFEAKLQSIDQRSREMRPTMQRLVADRNNYLSDIEQEGRRAARWFANELPYASIRRIAKIDVDNEEFYGRKGEGTTEALRFDIVNSVDPYSTPDVHWEDWWAYWRDESKDPRFLEGFVAEMAVIHAEVEQAASGQEQHNVLAKQ
jgi:hypothetical protein